MREAGGAHDFARESNAPPVERNAVQRLRPPLVRRDAQPRNRRSRAHQLRYLLVQRQPRNQVLHSLLNRQGRVAESERFGARVGRVARVRRPSRLGAAEKNEI